LHQGVVPDGRIAPANVLLQQRIGPHCGVLVDIALNHVGRLVGVSEIGSDDQSGGQKQGPVQ
jgi:hypothetical protein